MNRRLIPGSPGVTSVLSESGEGTIDEARIDLMQRLIIDSEATGHPGAPALYEYVGALYEAEQTLTVLLLVQSEDNAPLTSVEDRGRGGHL
jgi:hypothetical protein